MTLPPRYIAIPKSGQGPGVLVLHSWWGLNPFFKNLCDRFSDNGFVALAPDLYDGKVASTVEAAKALRAQATASRRVPCYKMLTAAINDLSRHEAVTTRHIATVGFSMGGHWALWLAQRPELPISATVIFYAARNGDFTRSNSRFLFHFAVARIHAEGAGRELARELHQASSAALNACTCERLAEHVAYPGLFQERRNQFARRPHPFMRHVECGVHQRCADPLAALSSTSPGPVALGHHA